MKSIKCGGQEYVGFLPAAFLCHQGLWCMAARRCLILIGKSVWIGFIHEWQRDDGKLLYNARETDHDITLDYMVIN